jgi:FMN phosphatase YigB (HAD superfamily)
VVVLEDIGVGKPDAAIFAHALAQLGGDAQTRGATGPLRS